jgi:AAA family ATP:ADP antiporter
VNEPIFSGLRAVFWPVTAAESKRVIPMGIMMGLILFNYAILRSTKDALIVTACGSGVEVICFVKVWCVVPAAFLFLFIYTKLANHLKKSTLFYGSITPFILFFLLFAFVLYPYREALHPALEKVQAWQIAYPRLKWFFPIYGYWSFVLYYIISELWQNVVLSLLFWQFANDINKLSEARRFYGIYGVISGLFVWQAGMLLVRNASAQCATGDAGAQTLQLSMIMLAASGFMVMAIYYYMNRFVVPTLCVTIQEKGFSKKKKLKLSFKESLRYVLSSPYIRCIVFMVLSYGICMNLIEMTWKHQMKLVHSNANDYMRAMGWVVGYTGLVSTILMLVGANILRVFNWLTAAIMTPIMIATTGFLFFAFVVFKDQMAPIVAFWGTSPIVFAAFIGQVQNILSKGTKYALFDPTKEMAYIPLDQELKVKGKATVDLIGERLGKASGSLVQQVLLVVTAGTQMDIAPYLGLIIVVMIGLWFMSVFSLNKRFMALADKDGVSSAEDLKAKLSG